MFPVISAEPVNWLQEPFPAARPASGKVSVACEFAIAGLPPSSSRLHCVPVKFTAAAGGAADCVGFLSALHPANIAYTSTAKPNAFAAAFMEILSFGLCTV